MRQAPSFSLPTRTSSSNMKLHKKRMQGRYCDLEQYEFTLPTNSLIQAKRYVDVTRQRKADIGTPDLPTIMRNHPSSSESMQ